ncbi:MAG: caspase family protein [Deltaproteobacteria bacterium]|nr:caspase family protein [Deltaproteobacteria bacterium]
MRRPFTAARRLPAVCGLGLLVALAAPLWSASPAAAAPAATPAAPPRRFALVVGANDGGPERPQLRYATADARAMSRLLGELGGVAAADRALLVDPDPAAVRAALAALQTRLAAAGSARTELLFYYSGHSDERGLLLGGQRLDYAELRKALKDTQGDVRIAILDSCSSGALVAAKGGQHVNGFLPDGSNAVEGHAYLTSSSADEVSQEAASIGGSFFTHALLTGMRGGADVNTDGLVTLNEAYRFAYDETLARTETTRFGPQHASFDIQLSGSGDLVMTDLRARTAPLVLDPALAGRLSVRDDQDRLVAELNKRPGAPLTLLLEPGRYTLTLTGATGPARATLSLDGANARSVAPSAFSAVSPIATARRGDDPAEGEGGAAEPSAAAALMGAIDGGAAKLRGADGVQLGAVVHSEGIEGFAFALGLNDTSGAINGAALALGGNLAGGPVDGAQVAIGINHSRGGLTGAQTAVGMNTAGAVDDGVQAAVGANISEGEVRGAQVAAGLNLSGGPLTGAQLSSGANLSRGALNGAQLSGGLNLAAAQVEGAQLSGGVNLADRVEGAQLAGGVNVAGPVDGAQISGGVNVARDLEGLQLAVVNVARDVDGLQLGVINRGHEVEGAMIGVINVAQAVDGAPIGLLNFVRDGIHDLELSSTPSGRVQGALKLGGREVYTSLAAEAATDAPSDLSPWAFGAGLGGRADLGVVAWDTEVGLLSRPAGWSPAALSTGALLQPRVTGALALTLLDRIAPTWSWSWNLAIPLDGGAVPRSLNAEPFGPNPELGHFWTTAFGLRVAVGPLPTDRPKASAVTGD